MLCVFVLRAGCRKALLAYSVQNCSPFSLTCILMETLKAISGFQRVTVPNSAGSVHRDAECSGPHCHLLPHPHHIQQLGAGTDVPPWALRSLNLRLHVTSHLPSCEIVRVQAWITHYQLGERRVVHHGLSQGSGAGLQGDQPDEGAKSMAGAQQVAQCTARIPLAV